MALILPWTIALLVAIDYAAGIDTYIQHHAVGWRIASRGHTRLRANPANPADLGVDLIV